MKTFAVFTTECALIPTELSLREFLIRYAQVYNESVDMKTLNTYMVMMNHLQTPCVRSGAIETMGFTNKMLFDVIEKGKYRENKDWIRDYDGSIIMTPKMAFSMMRCFPIRRNRFHRNVKFLHAGLILYPEYKNMRLKIDEIVSK